MIEPKLNKYKNDMRSWNNRPSEIANNYNPAYCGEIIYNVIFEYEKTNKSGFPFALIPIVLPIILHDETRCQLKNSKSSFVAIFNDYPELKITFPIRAANLLDTVLESYLFLLKYEVITYEKEKIFIKNRLLNRNKSVISDEIKQSINKSKILGRILARNIDVSTLYYMMGVRP